MSELGTDIKTALQYLMPGRMISRLTGMLTKIRWRWLKNLVIANFARAYGVDLSEARSADPNDYEHFNAFFTRALKADARPMGEGWLSPADGVLSQSGAIRAGRIIQAKGLDYSVAELLADDDMAARYQSGSFATIYLSPRDYHRLHMPWQGRLLKHLHVPGRLFSVALWTVARIPRLLARNERLVAEFESDAGRFVLVLVGAVNVGSIETVWAGTVTPPYGARISSKSFESGTQIVLDRGSEMGRFNLGSTIVMLSERKLNFVREPGSAIRMGQSLASNQEHTNE
jgi:phosphatidylserine decarboxylase